MPGVNSPAGIGAGAGAGLNPYDNGSSMEQQTMMTSSKLKESSVGHAGMATGLGTGLGSVIGSQAVAEGKTTTTTTATAATGSIF